MVVQLLNPDFGIGSDVPFLGTQALTCPRNTYSLAMDPGTAYLRVTLPVPETELTNLGELPWRHLDLVEVGAEGVDHDVSIVDGTRLGGTATLDGAVLQSVFLQVAYAFNRSFGATNAFSDTLGGPSGSWLEFFGRAPMILQNGVRYSTFSTCASTLGTRLVSGFPPGDFDFPAEVSALNCILETGAAVRFSHTLTRLVVTPLPGDIGGSFSTDFFDQFGVGWGAQFAVSPGTSPSHDPSFSHIFNGGLLIGIGENQVLAGADASSMMECGATCRDLGPNGTVKFTTQRNGSRSVTWRYSDATSAEAAGLEITQVSVDGKLPNDYVLFEFSIRNIGSSTITFHAGFFGDWDIDADAGDDLGATDLAGKLMYEVSANETGVHAGTVLLGAPVTGNFFFDGFEGAFPSTADQVQALKGGLSRESAGPGDLRYIHGAGPITLRTGQRKALWIAVVAGDSKAELLANAAAAEADVAGKMNQALDASDVTTPVLVAPDPRPSRPVARPICKNCQPQ